MPVQAFVDESGGKGDTGHFVACGLVSNSERWSEFSDEWTVCLREPPAPVQTLKMREAAGLNGQFYGVSGEDRDQKLLKLARIINRHAEFQIFNIIDLNAHAQTWEKYARKPMNEPYFWPFHNLIMGVAFTLWDAGWRERFEIIFDEQVIYGPRARAWYPVTRSAMKHRYPEECEILPVDPVFRPDDEFLPIQAADLFAWCYRKNTDEPESRSFEWLLPEMTSVSLSEYSGYYDKERMEKIISESEGHLKDPSEIQAIIKAYVEIYGDLPLGGR